jgi:hypothetical protein
LTKPLYSLSRNKAQYPILAVKYFIMALPFSNLNPLPLNTAPNFNMKTAKRDFPIFINLA